jgi:hypothetical protein
MTGKLDIAGILPPADLSYSHTNDELYLGKNVNHPRKTFSFSQPAVGQLFSSKPLVAIGLPPFANLADAAARYVHEIAVAHNQTPHERALVIVLHSLQRLALLSGYRANCGFACLKTSFLTINSTSSIGNQIE